MSETLGNGAHSEGSVDTQKSRKPRSTRKRVGVAACLLFAATTGLGYAAESHTNEVAEGKIKTAEVCRSIDPKAQVITEKIDACMERGVPGGDEVGKEKLREGDPMAFFNAYVEAQKHEAAQVEPGRVALWGIGIPVGVAVALS